MNCKMNKQHLKEKNVFFMRKFYQLIFANIISYFYTLNDDSRAQMKCWLIFVKTMHLRTDECFFNHLNQLWNCAASDFF